MKRFYIGYVVITPGIEQKLLEKHNVTAEEVRDACQRPNLYIRAFWHFDDIYGWRLLITGQTRAGRRLKIILKPLDAVDGTWILKTAFEELR